MGHFCRKLHVLSIEDDKDGKKTISGKCDYCGKEITFKGCYPKGLGTNVFEMVIGGQPNHFVVMEDDAIDPAMLAMLAKWRDDVEAERKKWTVSLELDHKVVVADPVVIENEDAVRKAKEIRGGTLLDEMTKRVKEDLEEREREGE
jgi:hypothetical protein